MGWPESSFGFVQTSFEITSLDCIVYNGHIRVHLKRNLIKIGNFCVAILILKMEEEKHFQHIVPFYFKKGKNGTETQIFMQNMEMVL